MSNGAARFICWIAGKNGIAYSSLRKIVFRERGNKNNPLFPESSYA